MSRETGPDRPRNVLAVDWPVRILGTGACLPRTSVSSRELDARHGRAPGSTAARSGVESRAVAAPDETASTLAAEAVRRALADAEVSVSEVDRLISTAAVGEQPMPTDAALILERFGPELDGLPAFDVDASCLGFLHGLEIAAQQIVLGVARTVVVVASEIASAGLDPDDLESSALFGDGAAAAVVGPAGDGDDARILAVGFETFARGAHHCEIRAGGTRWNPHAPPPSSKDYRFSMDGLAVFRLAAETLPGFLDRLLEAAGCELDDLDLIVPHQASALGLRFLVERLGADPDRVVRILESRGNQVAASIPSALHEVRAAGRMHPGDRTLLIGTAAGFSLGGIVLRA